VVEAIPYALEEDPYWAYVREQDFDLGAAAIAIGAPDHPELDIAQFVAQLDHLGSLYREKIAAVESPIERLRLLGEVLSVEAGLKGNEEDYYDPRNSYLHEVLERRLGIPISLSVIYIEVARRGGVRLQGIGSPGHFFVRSPEADLFADPFYLGQILTREEAIREVLKRNNGRLPPEQDPLPVVDKRSILLRMLGNLKRIYLERMDFERALHVVNKLIILDPDVPQEYRDRGVIHFQLELIPEGISDLERFLSLAPQGPETRQVREQVSGLKRMLEMMR
jgi:regulator of sirC expression with transglutaminase-like and TPR domain